MRTSPASTAIFTAAYRRDLENLLAACNVPEPDRRLAAIGISAIVDGLWLELCLGP